MSTITLRTITNAKDLQSINVEHVYIGRDTKTNVGAPVHNRVDGRYMDQQRVREGFAQNLANRLQSLSMNERVFMEGLYALVKANCDIMLVGWSVTELSVIADMLAFRARNEGIEVNIVEYTETPASANASPWFNPASTPANMKGYVPTSGVDLSTPM